MAATFTVEDVAKHNTPGDAWVIVDNKVYDISKFMNIHPGGKGMLLPHLGKDATKVFFELHRAEVLSDGVGRRICKGVIEGEVSKEGVGKDGMPDGEDVSKVPFAEPAWLRGGGWKSPYHNETHVKFRAGVRAFLREHVYPIMEDHEVNGEIPDIELFQLMGQNGILASRIGTAVMPFVPMLPGVKLPGDLQPDQFDFFHEQIAHEEIYRMGAPGFADGLATGMVIGLPAVVAFAPDKLRMKIGAEVLTGNKRICLAISEPGAGSDVAGMSTYCTKSADGQHYIISGVKKWITNGHFADYFVTACKGPGKGHSMILVPRGEGLETKPISTSYSPAAGTALVMYDEIKVPVSNLLGKENEGLKIVFANFNHERWYICVGTLAYARRIVEDCWKWSQQRKVFGAPLIEQPVIRNKMARIIGALESAYSWLENITYQMGNMSYEEQFKLLGGPLALLKYQTTRTATLISDEACQIFGGRSITKTGMGASVERFQRTFKFASILGGSEEIMADLGIRQSYRDMPATAKL